MLKSNTYSGIERFKCGCVLYLQETETEEVIVKVEKCEVHKADEQKCEEIEC